MSTVVCPGVDEVAWGNGNQAPLYPAKVNHWLLVRSLRDGADESAIARTLTNVMSFWFERHWADLPAQALGYPNAGPVDNIQIRRASKSLLTLSGKITARREKVKIGPVPLLATGPYVYLDVVFNYRGTHQSIDWPVFKSVGPVLDALDSLTRCPVKCDWMLAAVGEPLGEAPLKRTPTTSAKEAAAKVVHETAKFHAMYLLATAVALGGVALIYRKVAK